MGESGEDLLQTMIESLGNFYANDVKLKDGVKEFLDYLQSKGIKMCIASATEPQLINIALKQCGIDKYFSKIITCNSSLPNPVSNKSLSISDFKKWEDKSIVL